MNNRQTFPSPQYLWEQLANKLRAQYWMRRNLTYGHGDEKIWFDLARLLTSRIVPMKLFIDSQFYSSEKRYKPLSPSELLGKKAFQRYEKYYDSQADDLEKTMVINLQSQTQKARTGINCKMKFSKCTIDSAVLDTLVFEKDELSPLFCYCLLSQMEKLSNMTQDYFLNAVIEYVPLRDEYDAVWGSRIPEGFRELALDTYCNLFAPAPEGSRSLVESE
ncbi:hypothetical protein [Gimesia maris]|uniref:Uncharacterized protein n=1 Tax=Gimesia maris TaxID=122 RepID=A0ABX5YLW6_9PLAN|nr:hypothetical protein [Gimesia maris]EDL59803.1 hypothetical protein PM8797T_31483 [Gimesia maris DSM 8797]QEG16706.1 hypothetical protein GmarT_25730 [Gimesia maris]QGQ30135.1 hypothetical protein F1729_16595 [Gimesia maris]